MPGRMVEAAERANRILTVGYDSRAKAVWRAAKQTLQAGAIGKIQQVNVASAIDRNFFWERNQPVKSGFAADVGSAWNDGSVPARFRF